jgi:hypothetical protein
VLEPRIYRWAPFVDAAPVRTHIETLREAGIGVDQIARLAGISSGHVRELVPHARTGRRPIQRVRPDTAERVLAVAVTDANRASRSHVDATGARRRLQALIAIGWTRTALAADLCRSTASLTRSMTSETITARTACQVSDLYERLWDKQPQHATDDERTAVNAARALAANRGWPPPMAWDDIDTDPSPYADLPRVTDELDEIAIERAMAGDGMRLETSRSPSRTRSCAASPNAASPSATSLTNSPPPNAPSPAVDSRRTRHEPTAPWP